MSSTLDAWSVPLRDRRRAPRFGAMTAEPGPEPTFDLDHYLNLPRVAGLVLAPDGRRRIFRASRLTVVRAARPPRR